MDIVTVYFDLIQSFPITDYSIMSICNSFILWGLESVLQWNMFLYAAGIPVCSDNSKMNMMKKKHFTKIILVDNVPILQDRYGVGYDLGLPSLGVKKCI